MSRPIIFDYVTLRLGENIKLFDYDYSKDMNVMKDNRNIKFIECDVANYESKTETRVQREADDIEYGLCELETKTEMQRERDDEEIGFPECISKTFANRERDDEDDYNFN